MAIKKTMVDALAFVTQYGNMSKDNLAIFTKQFCEAKDGSTTTGTPREAVKLYDVDGVLLGRKCTVTGKWFGADCFYKDGSIHKEADAAKAKLYTESKKMESEAQRILDEAREITDMEDKLAAYERYDTAMVEAKNHRLQPLDITIKGGFDTIQDLAAALGVDVITEKPKVEEVDVITENPEVEEGE